MFLHVTCFCVHMMYLVCYTLKMRACCFSKARKNNNNEFHLCVSVFFYCALLAKRKYNRIIGYQLYQHVWTSYVHVDTILI